MIIFRRDKKDVVADITSRVPVNKCIFVFRSTSAEEWIAELVKDRLNADFEAFKDNLRDCWKAASDDWQRETRRKQRRVHQLLKFIRGNKLKAPKVK